MASGSLSEPPSASTFCSGGDNLDFALARHVEKKLKDVKLTLRQRYALRRACCAAKERLLSDSSLAARGGHDLG